MDDKLNGNCIIESHLQVTCFLASTTCSWGMGQELVMARIPDGGSQDPPPNFIHNEVSIDPWPSSWTTELLLLCGSAMALLSAKVTSSLRRWWNEQMMGGGG